MPEIIEAEVLYRPDREELRFLPEGPYPLGESVFSWVAIQHGASADHGSLNVFDLRTGENQSRQLPGRPGFAFPCETANRFVVGCERRLGIFDIGSGDWEPFGDEVDADREGTIINDGLVWENNLIFGTKDLEFATKKAGLYLYRGGDGKLIRLRDDQICSNGKSVRRVAEGLELVDIDSPTRQVVGYALDIDAGALGEPTVLLDLTADPAVPDGAILSPDGQSIVISMYNPNPAEFGETREYALGSGELLRVWRTPGSPQNTCPNLVEHDGKVQLVITTAVEHMPVERQAESANAGALFVADSPWAECGSTPRWPA